MVNVKKIERFSKYYYFFQFSKKDMEILTFQTRAKVFQPSFNFKFGTGPKDFMNGKIPCTNLKT